MSRPVKIVAIIIGAIAALFAVVAIAFLFLFDPNDFKEKAQQAVLKQTGRELVIEGDVSLQVFPWLAVEVGESRLGNAPGFGDEPFAAFDSVSLSVHFLPLLSGEVVVGTAAIDGLLLNFEARSDGSDNWSDLGGERETQAATDDTSVEGGQADGKFEVSGFAITNATINYSDGVGPISVSDANFTIDGVAGEQNVLSIGAISFEALVAGLTEIPTNVSFDTAGIVIDNGAKLATIEPLSLSVLGIDMHAELEPVNYADSVHPAAALRIDAFSPRSVMTQLGMEPIETVDPSALSHVSVSAAAKVGDETISLSGIEVELDDTTFAGSITLPMSPDGRIRVNVSGDAIDLNRYMAPASEEEVEEVETAPIEIPVDVIRLLNVQGDFTIASVRIANIEMENTALTVNAADGRLRMHPISADLYGGSYNGDVRIDASGDKATLSLDENVDGVDLAKLAAAMFDVQNITGSIAGNFKLGGSGNDMDEIRQTLSGSMSFALLDGTYEGTDVWHSLRSARATILRQEPPEPVLPARTPFSRISASGVVTNGVMRNDDFIAELPFMRLTGAGEVDLGGGTVDYGLQARVISRPELMGDATADEIADLTKRVIPLRISGPLSSPSVRPDAEQLIKDELEDELKEKAKDKLKDLFKR